MLCSQFDTVYLKVFEIIHYNTEEDFLQGGEFGPAVVYGEEARLQHRLINKLFWGTLIQTIAAASYFLEAATTFQKQKKFTVDLFWLLLEKLGSDIILAYVSWVSLSLLLN